MLIIDDKDRPARHTPAGGSEQFRRSILTPGFKPSLRLHPSAPAGFGIGFAETILTDGPLESRSRLQQRILSRDCTAFHAPEQAATVPLDSRIASCLAKMGVGLSLRIRRN